MRNDFMWAMLIHLGHNMWNEEGNTKGREHILECVASKKLICNKELWDEYILYMHKKGVNTVIIDIGEGMRYESHPELAVEGSWTQDEMKAEIAKLRAMGFEVVPKLNFSAGHDVWLGEYAYMLSTSIYRQVCADLIKEVCEVFKPKYFHLGMDEETWPIQKNYEYVVIRQGNVYWRDFYHLVDCVEKEGVRAWIWSDLMWDHMDEFLSKMPKSVLQSNWYYKRDVFNPTSEKDILRMRCFDILDEHGFDQVPTGSNYREFPNMKLLGEYSVEHIAEERLLGLMQAPWYPTVNNNRCRNYLFGGVDAFEDTMNALGRK